MLQLYLLFCSALLTECLEKALFVVESGVQLTRGWKKEIFVALKGTCILIKPLFYFVFMYIVFKLFCMNSCFICELCITHPILRVTVSPRAILEYAFGV